MLDLLFACVLQNQVISVANKGLATHLQLSELIGFFFETLQRYRICPTCSSIDRADDVDGLLKRFCQQVSYFFQTHPLIFVIAKAHGPFFQNFFLAVWQIPTYPAIRWQHAHM
jgi:hypothetical protein